MSTAHLHARRGESFDAVIVGSGPNGFAAGITLAEKGWRVLLLEGRETVGGGMRSAALTGPGYIHDVCSAIHPMGVASPFFRRQGLTRYGLEWLFPDVPMAHPVRGNEAVALYRDLDQTAAGLGVDARRYRALFEPLVAGMDSLMDDLMGPFGFPRHPLLAARFGLSAVRSAESFAKRFQTDEARALFAGNAAHAVLRFDSPLSSAVGIMLMATGHAIGWPVAKGGSQSIARALEARFAELGGVVETGWQVSTLADLPAAKAVVFDVSPRALAQIAGDVLPSRYVAQLQGYRHGPAAYKVDFALRGPVPWSASVCREAGTVHLGGTFEEVAAAEKAAWAGEVHPRPFVLVGQQSLIDRTRAPEGRHTCWAYCHVPNGSEVDCTGLIEAQIERFAPGFRELIEARHVMRPADYASYNPNYVGGDIVGGVQDWRQLFTRPAVRMDPYSTPNRRIFICSASTPPGAGVHGMGGYHAALSARARCDGLAAERLG